MGRCCRTSSLRSGNSRRQTGTVPVPDTRLLRTIWQPDHHQHNHDLSRRSTGLPRTLGHDPPRWLPLGRHRSHRPSHSGLVVIGLWCQYTRSRRGLATRSGSSARNNGSVLCRHPRLLRPRPDNGSSPRLRRLLQVRARNRLPRPGAINQTANCLASVSLSHVEALRK